MEDETGLLSGSLTGKRRGESRYYPRPRPAKSWARTTRSHWRFLPFFLAHRDGREHTDGTLFLSRKAAKS